MMNHTHAGFHWAYFLSIWQDIYDIVRTLKPLLIIFQPSHAFSDTHEIRRTDICICLTGTQGVGVSA